MMTASTTYGGQTSLIRLLMPRLLMAILLGGLALGTGCGPDFDSMQGSAPKAKRAKKKGKKKAKKKKEAEADTAAAEEGYAYTSIGKRDPFESFFFEPPEDDAGEPVEDLPPQTELEQWDISQIRLVGIVTGISNPRAMVEAPNGKGYIVTRGTLVGRNRGRVSSIRLNEVIVTEEYRDVTGKRVKNRIPLRLPVEEVESDQGL